MISDGAIVDDKYRILRPLGGGAMGKVYLAEKLSTHERFAIKFVHDYLMSDETYYARFEREINALRGIRHPHVVATYDWRLPERGKGGSAYIVMEYLAGESMQQALVRAPHLPLDLVVRIMLQVLDALATVHALGVIHRDLSPANVFLSGDDPQYPSAKIVDFGLAKGEAASSSSDSAGGVTQDGAVLGRAAYAAPEMFLGHELDQRADIFACGMILYRALAGRFPYRESKTELMWVERYAQRHEEGRPYPSARTFRSSIPTAVDQIISLAIRKRPQERYQAAESMQHDLLRVEETLHLAPKAETAGGRAPAVAEAADASTTQSTTEVDLPATAAATPPALATADSGSPTPGPTLGRAERAKDQSASGAAGRGWGARHPRARVALAGGLVLAGLTAVLLAVALHRGAGAPGGEHAAAARRSPHPGPAAAATTSRDASARETAAAGGADGGAARPPADVAATAVAADAAGEARAPDKVRITLQGLPEGAEASVGDVKVVDDIAVVPRSDVALPVHVAADGFHDFDDHVVPISDTFFFVMLEPLPESGGDAGDAAADAGAGSDAGATPPRDAAPPPRRDTGTPPRRDTGATTHRDAGTPPHRDGGLGIIVNYDG